MHALTHTVHKPGGNSAAMDHPQWISNFSLISTLEKLVLGLERTLTLEKNKKLQELLNSFILFKITSNFFLIPYLFNRVLKMRLLQVRIM